MTQNNQGIDTQAAEWAVRLHLRPLTADEQAELHQWLEGDVRHRGALLRARAAWVDLDRLAALAAHREMDPADSARTTASLGPAEEQAASIAAGDVAAATPHRTMTFSNRRSFLAASVAALAVGVTGTWWYRRRSDTYVSRVGEVRRVALSDGSHMVLNTDTEATVDFDSARREIRLRAGEGLFQVAKDPGRPFIVRTGAVSVRAVGTVFSVRSVDNRVDVTVTEGVVELKDESGSGPSITRRVTANEHATVLETSQVDVQRIPQTQVDRGLAWRDGMVDFDGESLGHAVEEINRHNHRHIVIDDPALAARPVVGAFRANDPDGFAQTVAVAMGIERVEHDDAIHLSPRAVP